MLDQLGVPEDARALAALAHPVPDGTALPAPARRVPTICRKTRRRTLMLIDSHCHLDYYTPDELPGVLGRAAEAGVGEVVTIGTRLSQAPSSIALTEAFPSVVYGRHPSASCGRGDRPIPGSDRRPRRASQGDRPRRVRARLFLRQGAACGAAGELPRPYPGRPAHGVAAGDPRPRGGRGHRQILREERDSGRPVRLPPPLLQLRPEAG